METSSNAVSHALSYKQQRYDRQLRLWGDHGQQRLEHTSVCLVNATGTGAETVKNLVLPGLGSFSIVDSRQLSSSDFESNFFALRESHAESFACQGLADEVCQGLLALNPDVHGNVVDNQITMQLFGNRITADHAAATATFFRSFGLVIICDPKDELMLMRLADILWQLNVPLLVVYTVGVIGLMRLQVHEHIVEESHPDYPAYDLRLEVPLSAFLIFADGFDLDALDNKDHAHVPWLVLLHKALANWRTNTQRNDFPTTYADKKCVRQVLAALRRHVDEENFREAEKAVNTALQLSCIPAEVQRIFIDDKCNKLSADSDPFWIIMHAIGLFATEYGQLPLCGTLPDMTSTSDWYVRLQQIYRDKALTDADLVHAQVIDLMQKFPFKHRSKLTLDFVRYLCKHAAHVRVVSTTRLSDELSRAKIVLHDNLSSDGDSVDAKNALWYKTYRRYESFITQKQRVPTLTDIDYWAAAANVGEAAKDRDDAASLLPISDGEQACWHEMCRFGGETLYSVRAFVGGIAGQEAVKLITRQYVPMREIIVCNGIECAVSSFQVQWVDKETVLLK